jgi:prepilin-type N-terminal cleavage/methylation domain-containing protein
MCLSLPRERMTLLENAFYKSNCSRRKPNRVAATLRLAPGFTLPELIVVVAVVSLMMAAGLVGYNRYKEQYALSGEVRALTHAISAVRVRAIETQSVSRLVLRPIQTTPVRNWTIGKRYNVGDIVQDGLWTYRCLVSHNSVATVVATMNNTTDNYVTVNGANPTVDTGTYYGNEPGATAYWNTNWEIIFDYQYNDNLLDVQHCSGNLAVGSQRCGDPSICTWAETKPYNTTSPVSIQFNWFGVPVDYVDHNIMLQGVQDVAMPAGEKSVGCVLLTVTALGRIRHQGER